MKSLLTLNPMIWNYRSRLFLGVVFILLTNVFAVWAPSMIGEGVNALNDANQDFLVPLDNGVPFADLPSSQVRVPDVCGRREAVVTAATELGLSWL